MSNPTPKTPEVIESVVVTDATPTVTEVPKTPGKVKTALRHPIQTIKRHNVVSTALIACAAGVASTLFFVKKDSDDEGSVSEDSSDDNVVDFPAAD